MGVRGHPVETRSLMFDGLKAMGAFFERAGEWSPSIRLTPREFDELLGYDTSLPTGTTPGKRWKRNANWYIRTATPEWWMGEYYEIDDKTKMGIHWRRIEILGAP